MTRRTLAVVMPNYNHAKYLPEAIESVLSQTRLPDEFLILDDASTDESVDIIQSYARNHSFIRLVEHDQNLGVHAAHRHLFELAQADYINAMAADDTRYPDCYKRTMEMADAFPEAGLIFGQMVMTTEAGEELSTWGASAWSEPIYADPDRYRREYLEREAPSQSLSPSTIYRRDRFKEVGWYCEPLASWGDTFAIHAIGLRYGACYVPEPFARWRVIPEGYSQARIADPRTTLDMINRAVYLMRSPEFREYFPPDYVRQWRRRFVWRTIKEYWRCDHTAEFPPGSPIWIRYRHRIPRTLQALLLFCHRTDLAPVKS
ncbi:MAG: hypothetical protein CMJ64_22720 [Planctomycetaceae bacterium]|nr:hypothetical protein [Planctomycetaceae bacterium]